MPTDEFNDNVNSNEGGSFDLNSFSTVGSSPEGSSGKSGRKKKRSPKNRRKPTKILLSFFLVCVITFSFVVSAFTIYVFGFIDDTIPKNLNHLDLDFTTTIYVQDQNTGEYVEYKSIHGKENRIWVDLADMPKYLGDAFIAIEDERFETHFGVDWKRTLGAFANQFLKFSSRFGGSTITQQLVKNLTMDTKQNAMRKVREIMRARRLEIDYDKDTILECYLNTIGMGGGRYGVEVAANYYFGKSVGDLSIAEAASLAAIVQSPEYNRPDTEEGLQNNLARQALVLDKMLELKYITKEEYDTAKAEKLNIVGDPEKTTAETEIYSYFIDALIDQVANDLSQEYDIDKTHASENVYSGGYKIYCTLVPSIQNAIEEVFTDESNRIKNKTTGELGQASITVMDYEGRVVGIAGGLGAKTTNRGLNRATSSPRQPGSTMKPIAAYAPALEDNLITYSSLNNDHRVNYKNGTWTPKNWYGGYWGKITTAYAIQRSNNTIPVMLVDQMTPEKSYKFLTENLGITTLNYPQDADLAPLGLGGTNGGLTTLESAAAYAVFGNGGYYYKPSFYTKVTDQRDTPILEKATKPRAAISEDTACIMNHMLQNVVYGSNGTGAGARSYVPHMKVYAKTGTSQETNDLWFVGGTPYYVASCWYGFDNNGTVSQSTAAQKLWGKVMSSIHSKLPAKQFTESEFVQHRYYCTSTGLLATNACPSVSTGWFKSNDRKTCTSHRGSIRAAIKDTSSTSGTSSSGKTSSTGSTSSKASSATTQTSSAAASSTPPPSSSAPPASSAPAPTSSSGTTTEQPPTSSDQTAAQ